MCAVFSFTAVSSPVPLEYGGIRFNDYYTVFGTVHVQLKFCSSTTYPLRSLGSTDIMIYRMVYLIYSALQMLVNV